LTSRIAISQRVVENQSYPETRDALARDWSDWIATAIPGAALLPVPNRPAGVTDWWAAAAPQALVLSGGNDWGEVSERDETERRLLDVAQDSNVPIFAVCRGLHVVNICFGGALVADLASITHGQHVNNHHAITLDDSGVANLASRSTLAVNSYHNQGVHVDGVADGFRVFARAEGQIVEGMVHESKPILAIQWHPERQSPSESFDQDLIRALFSEGPFWVESQ
jgi:anthranilate/para-aminobenzoate synthase component II